MGENATFFSPSSNWCSLPLEPCCNSNRSTRFYFQSAAVDAGSPHFRQLVVATMRLDNRNYSVARNMFILSNCPQKHPVCDITI